MEHIVAVMVDGRKIADIRVELTESDWDQRVVEGLQGIGEQVAAAILVHEDDALRAQVPATWQNRGRERRQLLTVAGEVAIERRVYVDEQGRRRKPLDEVLGLMSYQHGSAALKRSAAYLASQSSYRQAARLLSWAVGEPISWTRVQRAVWEVGEGLEASEAAQREAVFGRGATLPKGSLAAPLLYAEFDGVWISLQREARRRVEARVAVFYTGKEAIASGRRGLVGKTCLTALAPRGAAWREMLLQHAYQQYDLDSTKLLVLGGDGAGWVRHSLDRFELPWCYQLDRFHLFREARRALPEVVPLVRRCVWEGFGAIADELAALVQEQTGATRRRLDALVTYLRNNADGLIDYRLRLGLSLDQHPSLGAIEGNVDKLVVQRMKGRGMSWRLQGARAMLAVCRHAAELGRSALPLRPAHTPPTVEGRKGQPGRHRRTREEQWLQAGVPLLHSSQENSAWGRTLRRIVNGEARIPC